MDPTNIVNKYLRVLAQSPPNRDKSFWKWTEKQKEILKIPQTKNLINKKKTNLSKSKKLSKTYNILIRASFDDF